MIWRTQNGLHCRMSGDRNVYTSFAIAGVGGIGAYLARALLAIPNVRVLGLTRLNSKSTSDLTPGLKVVAVDYADAAGLADALRGVEVVISTLSGDGWAIQPALADAAKAAGVKLFVPSEFGTATEGLGPDVPILGDKAKLHAHLESIGLPYARFYTGMWPSTLFTPEFGFDIAERRVKIAGDGTALQTFTTARDAAHFTAYILTHLPPAALTWRSFRVAGETLSFLAVVRRAEVLLGDGAQVKVEWEDPAQLKETIARVGVLNAVGEVLRLLWAEGYGNIEVGGNDNALVPGWKPMNVDEALAEHILVKE